MSYAFQKINKALKFQGLSHLSAYPFLRAASDMLRLAAKAICLWVLWLVGAPRWKLLVTSIGRTPPVGGFGSTLPPWLPMTSMWSFRYALALGAADGWFFAGLDESSHISGIKPQ